MRIMIDTNIFISAVLFPNGKAAVALLKALVSPYQPVTCDYVIDELRRKFREKWPERITELDAFLYTSLSVIEVVKTPETSIADENLIRDEKDRPILHAALDAGADLFLPEIKTFWNPLLLTPG